MIPHSRPEITARGIQAVVRALRQRRLAQGDETAALEDELSRMFGGADAVVVSSGTAALYLSLAALGVGRGKKVVIPSYTCNALYSAVCLAGATPVCADVPENGLSITRGTVDPVMDRKTAAIIAPHTCGYLADIDGLLKLGVPVIEDCAQAVGGRYRDGRLVGTRGDVAALSFYATKLLSAGEGGACITRNRDVARRIRRFRNCDEQAPDPRAFNFKMPDTNAALAREELKNLTRNAKKRAGIAETYDRAFGAASFRASCAQIQTVCFRYLVDVGGNPQSFLKRANAAGIVCRRPVWRPLHRAVGGRCPVTERLEKRLVSVPLYPGLSAREIAGICAVLPEMLDQPRPA